MEKSRFIAFISHETGFYSEEGDMGNSLVLILFSKIKPYAFLPLRIRVEYNRS